ncbi:MAG TPA: hypothetical protein VFO39_21265 [Candidatus Sulfotelmatobacter sp.]|nr:hypothetical protein [Candidatus Sulfotelmatobacter sp.]
MADPVLTKVTTLAAKSIPISTQMPTPKVLKPLGNTEFHHVYYGQNPQHAQNK